MARVAVNLKYGVEDVAWSQWKRSFRRKLAKSQNGLVNQNKPVDSQYIQGVAVKAQKALACTELA